MKTKILVLATLLLGGLIFTSCQKDNTLFNDNLQEQNAYKVDPGDTIWLDLLRNYPDPFNSSTTIEYRVTQPQLIKLTVRSVGSEFATVLVNEEKEKGIHKILYSGKGLPVGEYLLELTIGGKIAIETMTKVNDREQDGPGWDD